MFYLFLNLQENHCVNEIKEELTDTIKVEKEFLFDENKYISANVSFPSISEKYFVLTLNIGFFYLA